MRNTRSFKIELMCIDEVDREINKDYFLEKSGEWRKEYNANPGLGKYGLRGSDY